MPSLLQNLPQGWEILPFSKCVNKISIKHKVKTKDYLKNGKYPIIDQAKDFISGYSNDENLLINIKKPVIVFGDHTRCFKFIDFNFIAGADGIKILSPIDEFNEKLFYYFCLALKFEDKGYSRHYQFLEKTNINIPPLEVQKAIVEKLENAFAHIDEAVHHLKAVQTNIPRLKSSLLHSAFSGKLTESQNSSHEVQTLKSVVGVEGEFERKEGETLPFEPPHPLIKTEIPQGWEIKTLGEVCKINPKNKLDDDLEVSFIPMNLIADKYQNKFSYEIRKWSEVKKGYTHLQNRCIAIAKITPCFENGKCVILQDLKNGYGAGTTELIVVLADENKILPKFVFYFFNTTNFTKEGVKNFKGTAGQLRISKDFITNLQIPLPPLATQNQIVQILESKFTHLDNLAQFVNASLENLQRLKSSLLNQAFKGELIC
ncbi:restriction endonuclease subunit S [Helicobacter typhlonius]|uniref:restriction endonuclease subunit S n=2 Tax=Helicobacter typhlonius TaxID=76936 RepID=UPI002FE3F6B6